MTNNKYPLKPDHITSDGDKSPKTSLSFLDGIGIIPNDYLKGMLTEIASFLKNPNTIIEFPPDISKPPVRTDAVSLHFDLHPPCREFRNGGGTTYCHECDNLHASFFRNLNRKNLDYQLQGKIESDIYRNIFNSQFCKESQIKIACSNKSDKDSIFLEYDCPILGYRELLFPIIFEDRVIGVMYVGELILTSQVDLIPERRNQFFALHKNDLENLPTYDTLLYKIEIAHYQYRNDRNNLYNDQEYNKLITDTQYQICKLVSRLAESMEIKRKDYISTKMDSYMKKLRDEISLGFPIGNEGFSRLWTKVEEILGQLNEDFPTKHIVIFSTKKYISDFPKVLEIVAATGFNEKRRKSLKYDLEKIPSSVLKEMTTSVDTRELFAGLSKEKLMIEEDFIKIFPNTFLPQYTLIMWIRYDRQVWDRLAKPGTQSDRAFDDAIQSLYTIITATCTSIWAMTAQQLMESVLKVFGHEMGQITPGLDAIRMRYLSPPHIITSLPNDKIKDIDEDTKGLLSQLHFIGERAKQLITSTIKVNFEEFWACNKLLYKWQNTFKSTTKGKGIKIIVQKTWIDDPSRPMVFGDILLLEQLIYNFLSNAIKYAYRGTNIQLDCKLNKINGDMHLLTVTDYGIDIGESREIFNLFQRGENVDGEQGLGIGLFLAQKIARAHGGEIFFEREKISAYNVPLIHKYLETVMQIKDEATSIQWEKYKSMQSILMLEKDKLEKSGYYDKIIAKYENGLLFYQPTIGEIIMSISKPTYQVTLFATIPRKE